MDIRNPYVILDVPLTATRANVEAAFKRAMMRRQWSLQDCTWAYQQLRSDGSRLLWQARSLDANAWSVMLTPLTKYYASFDFRDE